MNGTEIIFEVEESPEGGFEARALGHSIFTEAETMEKLREMIRDAVRCHFDPESAPRLIRLHLVKDEVIPA
ncbi:MAG TPA: 2-oxoisovalerate dehydrogenase [Terriglobia bacterium]|nr:2-oxoisovalerate dehydrogenase [Terriglobia bacterium]